MGQVYLNGPNKEGKKPKSQLKLPRIPMWSNESLNQSLQGDLEKISYMSSNGPQGNCCKVPSEHVIGHVLIGQNGGSTHNQHIVIYSLFCFSMLYTCCILFSMMTC